MSAVDDLLEVIFSNERLVDRIIDVIHSSDSLDYDNHSLAIDASKRGKTYYPLILALSDRGLIFNHTRRECLKNIDTEYTNTRLQLLRDYLIDIDDRSDSTKSMIDKMVFIVTDTDTEDTLEEALSIVDRDCDSTITI